MLVPRQANWAQDVQVHHAGQDKFVRAIDDGKAGIAQRDAVERAQADTVFAHGIAVLMDIQRAGPGRVADVAIQNKALVQNGIPLLRFGWFGSCGIILL